MADEAVIRLARHDDIERLVELASTTFRDTYRLIDDPDDIEDYVKTSFTPSVFASILDDPTSTLLVVDAGGRLLGYSQVQRSAAPPCVTGPTPIELARLYLREEALGKGLGAALIRAAHAEARRHGCHTLWLGVYDRNERAREFYRRFGFTDVGTKEFLFGGRSYADPVMAAPVRREP
jgi:GNAT superfamily N-acetyltransferase